MTRQEIIRRSQFHDFPFVREEKKSRKIEPFQPDEAFEKEKADAFSMWMVIVFGFCSGQANSCHFIGHVCWRQKSRLSASRLSSFALS